ncbi:MAG: DJ-1/PfpI family protein, partial [Flavobacteriales bacterium]|nr:DJ-1/PfpI family protein [Flavobacteriales bacterium]
MKKKILIPIPSYGFDPSETAIPWKLLSENNFEVIFATPNGEKAEGDKIMVTGEGLGIFKGVLKARQDAVDAYWEMYESIEFSNPIKYEDIIESDYAGIFLPGGHDKKVKEYLESEVLQNIIPKFFNNNKKVGAVCHSLMLLARSKNPETKKSVIYDYNTTS